MNLLECLVGLALSLVLIAPLIKNSGEFIAKQIQYEKSQSLTAEADRALELIGRAIRMAGYQNANSAISSTRKNTASIDYLQVQKSNGYRGSDSLMVKQEISPGVDFDCIGNTLSKERTKNNLAQQGFLVDRQASAPKGVKVNGGSLICQSLDRQGRIINTTLMNGIHHFSLEALPASAGKAYKVKLEMTDGVSIHQKFERTFTTRNLLWICCESIVIIAWVLSLLTLLSMLVIQLERLSALEVMSINTYAESQREFIAAEQSLLECERHISNLAALDSSNCSIQSAGKNLWLISSKSKPSLEIFIFLDDQTHIATRLNWRQKFE